MNNQHSADDPCPVCQKLRDENGLCDCPESWKKADIGLFCICKEDAVIDKNGQCKVCGFDEKPIWIEPDGTKVYDWPKKEKQ